MGNDPHCLGSVPFGFYDYQGSVRFRFLLTLLWRKGTDSVVWFRLIPSLSSITLDWNKCADVTIWRSKVQSLWKLDLCSLSSVIKMLPNWKFCHFIQLEAFTNEIFGKCPVTLINISFGCRPNNNNIWLGGRAGSLFPIRNAPDSWVYVEKNRLMLLNLLNKAKTKKQEKFQVLLPNWRKMLRGNGSHGI